MMNIPSGSTCTALSVRTGFPVSYDGESTEDVFVKAVKTAKLSNTKEELAQALEKVRGETSELRRRVRVMEVYFEQTNQDILLEIHKINQALQEEEEKRAEKERKAREKKGNKEQEESLGDIGNYFLPGIDEDEDLYDKVSELFKRIAARCHPDKTKRKRLHELFKRAHRCKKQMDYDGLVAIWHEIDNSMSNLLKRLMADIKVLENQLQQERNNLQVLKQLETNGILSMYENEGTRHYANVQFRQGASEALAGLRARLNHLRGNNQPVYSDFIIML